MPNNWKVEIPTFGEDKYPDGSKKNNYLICLEGIGTGTLTSIILMKLVDWLSDSKQANPIHFRLGREIAAEPEVSTDLHSYLFFTYSSVQLWSARPERFNALFIALFGQVQKKNTSCAQCAKPTVGVFQSCIRMEGFQDGCCANCVNASGDARKACISMYFYIYVYTLLIFVQSSIAL